jgi:hypothetical protein
MEEKILEFGKRSTRSHFLQNSLWKRLRNYADPYWSVRYHTTRKQVEANILELVIKQEIIYA